MKDQSCNGSLCIRRITRNYQTGDFRFELQIRTSMGVLTIKGYRWIRSLNRIQPPTAGRIHLISQPADFRAAVRRLFVRLMLEQNKFVVPPPRGRKKKDDQGSSAVHDVRPGRVNDHRTHSDIATHPITGSQSDQCLD